ncbi:MAG: DNA-3-methyladenine glycosylase [Thermoleophilaceae bacterium]|jgi:DNA-3-methyladenine glycosylase I|nr:DNA-3-methyladenine glycosylase [Thermoleophilaceae bacterium]
MNVILGEDGLARCPWAASDPLMRDYHDSEWGVPVHGEQGLFERISLEAFQAGLSWRTILTKRPAFRAAFAGFDPDAVAGFTDDDLERLMTDAGIVRNRAKIQAARTNARATLALREGGGLERFIWSHVPGRPLEPRTMADLPATTEESKVLSKDLRSQGFAFVGPTTAYALMTAIGLVDGHLLDCHRRSGGQPVKQRSR